MVIGRSLLWKVAPNVYEVIELPGLRKALGATGEKADAVHAKRELSALLLAVKQFISLLRDDILTFWSSYIECIRRNLL